jgi:uncharacterized coiled-coil protein SlyX
MSDLSDLRHRVAALEALTAKQASDIETIAKLAYNVATAVNRNADICTRNFEKIAAANNSLAEAIAKPDESEWWKRGGDNDGEGDTGVQAP